MARSDGKAAEATLDPARGRRSAQTRNRILKAAVAAFARSGFEGASTRKIASIAGENHGLLTYHFGAKDDLWKEAVRSLFDEFRVWLEQHVQETLGLDVRTRAIESLRFLTRSAARRPELFQVLAHEGTEDSERMKWFVDEYVQGNYVFAEALYNEATEAGLLPKVPFIHYFYIFVGAAQLFFAMKTQVKHLTGDDVTEPAMIEAHADALVALILR